jgi:hypothetical protein
VRKLLVVVTLPSLVLTVMGPVTAPEGTVAAICVVETMLTLPAASDPNLTVAPLKKFPPKIFTVVPLEPTVGVNEAMEGKTLAKKLFVLKFVPALVITVMGPSPAPTGTVTETWVGAM